MTDTHLTSRDPVTVARGLVGSRFPEAVAAWLGGSAAAGRATATSDLDVTVLLPGEAWGGTVHRTSLVHDGWPVELFVHVDTSVRHYVEKDRTRRRPTMARLVGEGVSLVGEAPALVDHCRGVLSAGPPPLDDDELALRRYGLTDLLDDLAGGGSPAEMAAVAATAWAAAAELLLAVHDRWWGSGKWLVRELEALDATAGTTYAVRLHEALADAVNASARRLIEVCEDVLDQAGGRLWGGYRAAAEPPPGNDGGSSGGAALRA